MPSPVSTSLTPCSDDRLQADIVNIHQAIHEDKSVQEVRYIHCDFMIVNSLTKQTIQTRDKLITEKNQDAEKASRE